MIRAIWLAAVTLAASAVSCSAERPPPQPIFASVSRSAPIAFRYPLVSGRGVVEATSLRGRPAVISFLTTYDLASQAQARFLSGVLRRGQGRVSAVAIVLESPDNRMLIEAFRDALKLEYPVALGDATLLAGDSAFGNVQTVPTTVVLDAESRLVWRHVGLAKDEEIETVLRGL